MSRREVVQQENFEEADDFLEEQNDHQVYN